MPKAIGIIPSRFASRRFPGKPLALLGGLPIIVRVLNQANQASLLDDIFVATDDERIANVVEHHGGKAILVKGEYHCGSERVAVAARNLGADIVLNIQGDEPLLSPSVVDSVAQALIDNPDEVMSTACSPMENASEADNPNIVKVVLAKDGRALYFSRSRIPFWAAHDKAESEAANLLTFYHHIGIYGFTHDFLQKFALLPRSPLEIAENLEQLRALENGYAIKCVIAKQEFLGIDSADELMAAERRLLK